MARAARPPPSALCRDGRRRAARGRERARRGSSRRRPHAGVALLRAAARHKAGRDRRARGRAREAEPSEGQQVVAVEVAEQHDAEHDGRLRRAAQPLPRVARRRSPAQRGRRVGRGARGRRLHGRGDSLAPRQRAPRGRPTARRRLRGAGLSRWLRWAGGRRLRHLLHGRGLRAPRRQQRAKRRTSSGASTQEHGASEPPSREGGGGAAWLRGARLGAEHKARALTAGSHAASTPQPPRPRHTYPSARRELRAAAARAARTWLHSPQPSALRARTLTRAAADAAPAGRTHSALPAGSAGSAAQSDARESTAAEAE